MIELRELFNGYAKSMLRRVGFDIRRVCETARPPPLYDSPLEVIRRRNSHELAALNCSLNECVTFNGMSFSEKGWHPFVQAAKTYIDTGVRKFEGSCLEEYYANWRPLNGRDALIGASLGPVKLDDELSYVIHLPWYHCGIEERAAYLLRIIEIENSAFGGEGLTFADGYGLQGPVSLEKGRLEYNRIIDLVDSIQKWGYDRWRGDVTVDVLKRGEGFRYLISHGHHRVAVMVALGHKFIPVLPETIIIEDCYAAHWSGVYKKVWKKEEALTYFNHLFDFDSLSWAKDHDLQ